MEQATEKAIVELLGLIERCCKHGSIEELQVLPELVKATAELLKVQRDY